MTQRTNALILTPAGKVETLAITAGHAALLGELFGTTHVRYPLGRGMGLYLAGDHEDRGAGPANRLAAVVLRVCGRRTREVYGTGLVLGCNALTGAVEGLDLVCRQTVEVVALTLSI